VYYGVVGVGVDDRLSAGEILTVLRVGAHTVYEIQSMYETSFHTLSERYFKASPWPTEKAIAPIVDNDHVFCLLYKEMWYRHLYARASPTLEQRCESWDNYCALFGVILHGNVNMQLPNIWLWEMVDEFIYQFQSFCQYRGKLSTKTPEELELLKRCDQVGDGAVFASDDSLCRVGGRTG
jgi:translation initiation factor 3 subunit L